MEFFALIALVGGMIGWIINLRVADDQRRDAKRLEITISVMQSAFHDILCSEECGLENTRLRHALSDILIFGSPEIVDLASKFMDTQMSSGRADPVPLLTSIRNGIRKNLGLIFIEGDMIIPRITVTNYGDAAKNTTTEAWDLPLGNN